MMGAKGAPLFAGRRSQFAKPRHIAPFDVCPIVRGGLATCEPLPIITGRLSAYAVDQEAAEDGRREGRGDDGGLGCHQDRAARKGQAGDE